MTIKLKDVDLTPYDTDVDGLLAKAKAKGKKMVSESKGGKAHTAVMTCRQAKRKFCDLRSIKLMLPTLTESWEPRHRNLIKRTINDAIKNLRAEFIGHMQCGKKAPRCKGLPKRREGELTKLNKEMQKATAKHTSKPLWEMGSSERDKYLKAMVTKGVGAAAEVAEIL